MLRLKQTVIWQLILMFFALSAVLMNLARADVPKEIRKIVDEIKSKVSFETEYQLSTEVEFILAQGEAARLICNDNPYGLKEILICPMKESLYHYTIWSDGRITGGGQKLTRLSFHRTQRPAPKLAQICHWQLDDGTVSIKFHTIEDAEPIHTRKIPEDQRIAGFVKLWSEVKYNFAFFDQVPDLDWDAVLEEYLPKIQQAKTVGDYYRVLKRCIALLQDGHTSVFGLTGEPSFRPPVEIQSLGGKAIIVGITTPEKIKDIEKRKALLEADLKLGDEITHIDDCPIKQILLQDIYPYIFASTPQWRDLEAYPRLLNGENDTEIKLSIKSIDKTTRQVALIRGDYPATVLPKGFLFQKLTDNIVYINLPGFGSKEIVDQFDNIFPEIQKAKGLIIDVRKNQGGNSAYGDAIISYLTNKPLKGSHWKTRQYMPAFRAWGKKEQWYEGDHDIVMPRKEGTFNGPIVVLTGPSTFSAGEDFVVPLHASGRAMVVGEKTGGSTGQPLFIKLPGRGSARICTKWDTYPDGREFVGVGIIPDVEVHPSPADIAAGRDVVLEKGLEVLRSKIK